MSASSRAMYCQIVIAALAALVIAGCGGAWPGATVEPSPTATTAPTATPEQFVAPTPTAGPSDAEIAADTEQADIAIEETILSAGSSWILESLNGESVELERPVTATYQDNGFLIGFDGCTHYEAQYLVDGSSLAVDAILTTDVACPASLAQLGRDYLDVLTSAADYRIEGVDLILTDAAGTELALLTEAPTAALNGSTWFVNSYRQPEADLVGVPEDLPIVLNFVGGKMTGNTTCVSFNVVYELNGNSLQIGKTDVLPLGAAKTECTGGGAAQVQTAEFLATLESTQRYAVAGPVLTLSDLSGQPLALLFFSEGAVIGVADVSETPSLVEEERFDQAAEIFAQPWVYVEKETSEGTMKVANPSDFVLKLIADGNMEADSPCASGEGRWQVNQEQVQFDLIPQQRPGCAADDASDRFISDLMTVVSYRLDGEALLLEMEYNTGTLKFDRADAAAEAASVEAGAAAAEAEALWHLWTYAAKETSTGTEPVEDPTAYVLEVDPAGPLTADSPCISAVGRWQIVAGQLQMDLNPQSRSDCDDDGASARYIDDLLSVTTYRFEDGDKLLLDLEGDAGTLEFSRAALE